MKIELTESGFKEIRDALAQNEKAATQALSRTINKVAKQVKTNLIREVAGELTLPRHQIREPFTIKKATQNNPQAEIKVQRIAVPLMDYKPRELKRGHSIRVTKQGGRKKLENTFEAIDQYSRQLFQREHDKRGYPIRKMYGPAVIEVTQDYIDEAAKNAEERLLTVFRHEFDFIQNKI